MQKCLFLVADLIVITDPKSLLSIFNSRNLCTILNPHILKLKEKTISYYPEKWHKAADAVSHNPPDSTSELYLLPSPQYLEDLNQIKDALDNVCAILLAHISNTTPAFINYDNLITFVALDAEFKSDEPYQLLKQKFQNGFPRT